MRDTGPVRRGGAFRALRIAVGAGEAAEDGVAEGPSCGWR